jgi:hypothetical protein
LINDHVFKVGSSIKGDFTRLKKQFPQLAEQTSFNTIDLKEYAIKRGIIHRRQSGTLDVLVEKLLGMFLPKDDSLRRSDQWEVPQLPDHLIKYAISDVIASSLVFQKASEIAPLAYIQSTTPPGTRVKLLIQEGGEVAAYGTIAQTQPTSLGNIRVKVPSKSRLVIDVETIIIPSAAAILHLVPSQKGKTKAGALTLGQLQASSSSLPFQVVCPISLLMFDLQDQALAPTLSLPPTSTSQIVPNLPPLNLNMAHTISSNESDSDDDNNPIHLFDGTCSDEEGMIEIEMLEAASQDLHQQKGKKRQLDDDIVSSVIPTGYDSEFLASLHKIIESPSDSNEEYTLLKKDIFHAFNMIPTSVNHGLRVAFLRALRDHIMRWDPAVKAVVDKTCRSVFKLTFDQMLIRNPRFIAARTPRYVPPPSILVPAIQHVYRTFGNALDAKTGLPLFSKEGWKKANAVLELAREGYLSDVKGVVLYEKAGIDKYGLQKYKSPWHQQGRRWTTW